MSSFRVLEMGTLWRTGGPDLWQDINDFRLLVAIPSLFLIIMVDTVCFLSPGVSYPPVYTVES